MKISILFISLFLSLNCFAQSGDEQILPKVVIEGHYYDGIPMAELPKDFAISSIRDKAGNRALLLLPMKADAIVPQGLAKYEIQRQKVKNLDEFEESASLLTGMSKATMNTDGTQLVEGKPLPGNFSLKDLEGNPWTKQKLQGKVVVVNVWYSGCGPCRKEMPILSTWKDEHPDVLFLSANFQTPEVVQKVVEKHGFNWTHLVNDNYFTKWVGGAGYPLTIIIGTDGKVKKAVHGTSEEIRTQILSTINSLVGK